MTQVIWQEDSDNVLTAELKGMQLVVSRTELSKTVRFLIRRQACPLSEFFMVQSGHRENVEQAMEAAESVATQFA